MTIRIGVIHTTRTSIQPLMDAFQRIAPHVVPLNFLDEGLMEQMLGQDAITPAMIHQLCDMTEKAAKCRVDGMLLACSAFTPHMETIARKYPVPVVGADTAMLRLAVEKGRSIGVIATVGGTAGPNAEVLLREYAEDIHKEIAITYRLIPEASAALKRGDPVRHDSLIQGQIQELSTTCEIVVLSQISMARAVTPEMDPAKVLTSPGIAITMLLGQMEAQRRAKGGGAR